MCQYFYLFVLQVIFYGAFQLQKLHQCALFCRRIFIFSYAFLIFYNFSSLTIYIQKGGLYIRPVQFQPQ